MFHALHIYTVHIKPGRGLRDASPVFVREGFNLYGFVFTLAWALYHRLWLASALMLAFNAGVVWLNEAHALSDAGTYCTLLAMQLVIGFHGNDWVRGALTRRGFLTAGIVTGDSRLRAELRFFEHYAGA